MSAKWTPKSGKSGKPSKAAKPAEPGQAASAATQAGPAQVAKPAVPTPRPVPAGAKAAVQKGAVRSPKKLTVEDLKHKAYAVRDIARDDVKHAVETVRKRDTTKYLIVGVVAVAAAISVAYYLGTRRAQG